MNKQKIIVGNWKSHKTISEAKDWIETLKNFQFPKEGEIKVIICVAYIHLPTMKELIDKYQLPLSLGIQDISPFPEGAYTGEISGTMLADFAKYVIIGHSERRKYFAETDDILAKKVTQAKESNIEPIYCIQDEKTLVPEGVRYVAYEPLWAIGTGQPDTPANANQVLLSVKRRVGVNIQTIYGGSVTGDNVKSYLSEDNIDGVLPGSASLDQVRFTAIIKNACEN